MATSLKNEKPDFAPGSTQARYWAFVRTEGLVLLVSYAALVLVSAVALTAYAPIMGWFGFIYLVAAAISLCGLGLFAMRGSQVLTERKSFAWLGIVGALAVALSVLYAVVPGPVTTDSPVTLVVNIQLIHSAIFYLATLIVGAVWHIWRWRKAPR